MAQEESVKPKWVAILSKKHHLFCTPFRSHFSSQQGEEKTGPYESKRNAKIT